MQTNRKSIRWIHIPDDIVISEILTRLPVKSLLKFRCVSKSWCSLISDDRAFIKSHLNKSTNNKSFTYHAIIASIWSRSTDTFMFKQCSFSSLFYDESSCFAYDKFTFINDNLRPPQGCSIVGCSNGLCCLRKERERNGLKDEFFLWNPATGKSHKLPAYAESLDPDHFTLAGFGFDSVHSDYKVLLCAKHFEHGGLDMEQLYSFNTNSWAAVKDNFNIGTYIEDLPAKFLNGKLYRLARASLDYRDRLLYRICCFDLEREVHGIVETPPNYDRDVCFLPSIGVLDGCLSYIIYSDRNILHVWVMKQYGIKESWNLLVSISFFDDGLANHEYVPICIGQGGEILFHGANISGFVMYNPNTKSCTSLRWPWLDIALLNSDVYVQSLVSPVPLGDCPINSNIPCS